MHLQENTEASEEPGEARKHLCAWVGQRAVVERFCQLSILSHPSASKAGFLTHTLLVGKIEKGRPSLANYSFPQYCYHIFWISHIPSYTLKLKWKFWGWPVHAEPTFNISLSCVVNYLILLDSPPPISEHLWKQDLCHLVFSLWVFF